MEAKLLKALTKDGQRFKLLEQFVDEGKLTQEARVVLEVVREHMEGDGHVDWGEIEAQLLVRSLPLEIYRLATALIEDIKQVPDSEVDEWSAVITDLQSMDIAQRIATVADQASTDPDDEKFDAIKTLVEQRDEIADRLDRLSMTVYQPADFDEIVEELVKKGGLTWGLPTLDRQIGMVQPGTLITIGARPDSGKTLFAMWLAVNFLRQTEGGTLLWFNNEERDRKIYGRLVTAITGLPREQILANPEKAEAEYAEYADAIKLVNARHLYPADLERLTQGEGHPRIVVIDQLYKLNARGRYSGETGQVAKTGDLFKWAREYANEYDAIVIAAHQADASAAGEPFIEMHQLYGSKTAIQGESDVVLTLGREYDDKMAFTRGLNIAKKKDSGPDATAVDKTYIELDIEKVGVYEI